MAKKMTMADIASLSGVGKSTVSRYFNGGYVKDETRAKIQKVIEEYNYTPNAFARLNAKQSNVIGVVVPTLNSKITSRVITSIDRYLREKGYTTLIQNSDHNIDQELQNIQRLIQLNVDGILISSIAITKDHKELLKKAGIPVVVLTQDYEDGISIIYDDYHAGKAMGEHIGKKGHQKVGYIGVYETDKAVGTERRNGVLDGLKEYGITPVIGRVITVSLVDRRLQENYLKKNQIWMRSSVRRTDLHLEHIRSCMNIRKRSQKKYRLRPLVDMMKVHY